MSAFLPGQPSAVEMQEAAVRTCVVVPEHFRGERHPSPETNHSTTKMRTAFLLPAMMALAITAAPTARAAAYSETFDGYAAGSQLHGVNGWRGWDNTPGAGAQVSNAFAFSGLNSVAIAGGSDLVQTFSSVNSGIWSFSMMNYTPSTSTGESYIILLNTYNDGGPYSWSLQTRLNMATGEVISDNGGGAKAPLIRDQWVPFRADINLDANEVSEYYNNQLVATYRWRDPADANSAAALGAVDLYGNSAGAVYYDSISLVPVPEPTAGLLGLLAMGGLLARRRR